MELIASLVLLFVGNLLIITTASMYRLVTAKQTEVFGKKTVWFAVLVTIAYYLSLLVLLT